jgi:hypothetical protein
MEGAEDFVAPHICAKIPLTPKVGATNPLPRNEWCCQFAAPYIVILVALSKRG